MPDWRAFLALASRPAGGPSNNDKITLEINSAANISAQLLTDRPPRKPRNADVRAREHLAEAEVERLIKAPGRCRICPSGELKRHDAGRDIGRNR